MKVWTLQGRRADYLDCAEAVRATGMTISEILSAINAMQFPAPCVGAIPGTPLWRRTEIEAFLQYQARTKRPGPPMPGR